MGCINLFCFEVVCVAHAITRLTCNRLNRREQLLVLEIGRDRIDTASSFVDYISDSYGFSKSSAWYCLKRLRELGLAEFANKEEPGKPLTLTRAGEHHLCIIERSKGELIGHFSALAYSTLAMQANPMLRG